MKNELANPLDLTQVFLVLGYIAVKDLPALPEKILVLDRLGYTNKQMALICDSTENTIAVRKNELKKKKKNGK